MGIYFDYDFEDGKEVENWVSCFLCGEKKVLLVEYHIKKGQIYTLYDNARKLFSGHEINIASSKFLVCDDCYNRYGSEEAVIRAVMEKKKSLNIRSMDIDPIKVIEGEIEETRREINKLLDKLGDLYEKLEREKIRRQTAGG